MPFFLKISDQFQDLTAQADIQGGGRLIGQQQARLAGQGHCNHGALALATAELVRVGAGAPGCFANTGLVNQLDGFGPGLLPRQTHFELQHLDNLLPHTQQGVERGHGLLENHGNVLPAHGPQGMLRQRQQILALKDGAADDCGVLCQAQQAQGSDCFTRS